MSTLRKQTRSGYTHISNDLLDAEGLSFRARGIAAYLLSKPDNWQVKIPHLMKVAKEGEKAIRTALQELAARGFIMRERVREGNGVITVTRIADYPAFLHIGTVEQRINGYQPQSDAVSDIPVSDIPVSDRSGTSSSRNRQVRKGEVLVNTDKGITDKVGYRQKKKKDYNEVPDDPRPKYSSD